MSYTISPVHTVEYYKNLALEMQEIGADSIAIKDMSGILLPEVAYELVRELKSVLRVPVGSTYSCNCWTCEYDLYQSC